jgi:hypothetical protein
LISSCQEAGCHQMRPGNSSIRFLFFASCHLFCVLFLVSCVLFLLPSVFVTSSSLLFSLFFFSILLLESFLLCCLSMHALSFILCDITDIVVAFLRPYLLLFSLFLIFSNVLHLSIYLSVLPICPLLYHIIATKRAAISFAILQHLC